MKRLESGHHLHTNARHGAFVGFTIVELLIVVVVIAILAVITIVSYNGVQNRAYDSSVQADLKAISHQIELFRVSNNEQTPQTSELSTLNLSVAKSAYATILYGASPTANNIIYCRPSTDTSLFLVAARSKSGNVFINGSLGPSQYTGDLSVVTSGQSTCSRLGMAVAGNAEVDRTVFYNGSWKSWVRG